MDHAIADTEILGRSISSREGYSFNRKVNSNRQNINPVYNIKPSNCFPGAGYKSLVSISISGGG
jgi:hypothetical protein